MSNELIRQAAVKAAAKIGGQDIRPEMFTPEQVETFGKVVLMADKSPVLNWKDDNHNKDFMEIGGKIEPVKDFCMKIELMANLNRRIVSESARPKGENDETYTVVVELERDERVSQGIGASTLSEVDSFGNGKRGAAKGKAEHFAITRAETRAFKRALETWAGMPFINMAIVEVFGGYDIGKGTKPKDVTPEHAPSKSSQVMREAVRLIDAAEKAQTIGPEVREALYKAFFREVMKATGGVE